MNEKPCYIAHYSATTNERKQPFDYNPSFEVQFTFKSINCMTQAIVKSDIL